MAQKIIFAKPLPENFVFIIVFEREGEIYLDDAFFADNAKELNRKIAENISGIENVRYDVSVFMQEGKDLRTLIPDVHVFCYTPKKKLNERIASQTEWLKEHLIIDNEYGHPDYIRFVGSVKEYGREDKTCNTIAVDILSDVAKYFRRIIGYE
ncbi:MAG: hypothetical protein FWF54_03580 [Candidatus Azobacteroides sp.]|nr:hypothetical protein [Candidatus Azobacteroides sp.]